MHQDLAAAPQGHARGGAHYRKRSLAKRPVGPLAQLDHAFDLIPGADVHGKHGQPQIGADREIAAFVVNHHRLELLSDQTD